MSKRTMSIRLGSQLITLDNYKEMLVCSGGYNNEKE